MADNRNPKRCQLQHIHELRQANIRFFRVLAKTFFMACLVFMVFATAAQGFEDNGNGTVTDKPRSVMYTQNANHGQMNWEDARSYCDSLSFAGFKDWYLPAWNQLNDVLNNPGVHDLFENIQPDWYSQRKYLGVSRDTEKTSSLMISHPNE